MHPHTRILVIYDSIHNSVFRSQILAPLKAWIKAGNNRNAYIITFEKKQHDIPQQLDGISIVCHTRLPYIGRASLRPCIWHARRLLAKHRSYEVIARGPFAGYIAYKAATKSCSTLTIQARGLAAQEYAFARIGKKNWITKIRTKQLESLEKKIYRVAEPNVHIEAVSKALKDYLIGTFNTSETNITIAHTDIPLPLEKKLRCQFRQAVRTQLGIAPQATVYCYNGSYKPWQCPEQTVTYVKQQLASDPTIRLLILTQDSNAFKQLIAQSRFPAAAVIIKQVAQEQLYRYLAAADYGLLFRDAHVINHTARPTKALDYSAAALTIVHNGTVEYVRTLPNNRLVKLKANKKDFA